MKSRITKTGKKRFDICIYIKSLTVSHFLYPIRFPFSISVITHRNAENQFFEFIVNYVLSLVMATVMYLMIEAPFSRLWRLFSPQPPRWSMVQLPSPPPPRTPSVSVNPHNNKYFARTQATVTHL